MSRPLIRTFNLLKTRDFEALDFVLTTTPIAGYDEFSVYNMRRECDIALSSTCRQAHDRPCWGCACSYSCGRQTVDATESSYSGSRRLLVWFGTDVVQALDRQDFTAELGTPRERVLLVL